MSAETQRMSEERLREIEQRPNMSHSTWWRVANYELIQEVRRLQQRERDLLTAVQLNEELITSLQTDLEGAKTDLWRIAQC